MNNPLISLGCVEQHLLDRDLDLFQHKVQSYLNFQGIEVANALVMAAKHLVVAKRYEEAISKTKSALDIKLDHPWAYYYQTLAYLGSNKTSKMQYSLKNGITASVKSFDETAVNAFLNLYGEPAGFSPQSLVDKYEPFGLCCLREESVIDPWNLKELEKNVDGFLSQLVENLEESEAKSTVRSRIDTSLAVDLYLLYFFFCKYLSLVCQKYKIKNRREHDRLVAVYEKVAVCIWELNQDKLDRTLIAERLSVVNEAISYRQFWKHRAIDDLMPPKQTVEVENCLQLYGRDIARHQQGIFVGTHFNTFTYYRLDRLDQQTKLLDIARIKRTKPYLKIIAYEHFWGGTEAWEII